MPPAISGGSSPTHPAAVAWKLPVKFFISILLSATTVLALAQAPSLHVHGHEATEQHAASFIHTHISHLEAAPSGQAEWRDIDPDDDAQFLNWVSITPNDHGFVPVILIASSVSLPVPARITWRTTVLRPNAHDPPALNATSPRAPPV